MEIKNREYSYEKLQREIVSRKGDIDNYSKEEILSLVDSRLYLQYKDHPCNSKPGYNYIFITKDQIGVAIGIKDEIIEKCINITQENMIDLNDYSKEMLNLETRHIADYVTKEIIRLYTNGLKCTISDIEGFSIFNDKLYFSSNGNWAKGLLIYVDREDCKVANNTKLEHCDPTPLFIELERNPYAIYDNLFAEVQKFKASGNKYKWSTLITTVEKDVIV